MTAEDIEKIRINTILVKLSHSKFRSSFYLKQVDKDYVNEKGLDVIRSHAEDFITSRLAPADISNDGKQTPNKGHPVFTAQHATACCCRGCFEKWHGIPKGRELTKAEIRYAVDLIMEWIIRNM